MRSGSDSQRVPWIELGPKRQRFAAGDDGSVWAGNREQPLTHISKNGHAQVFTRTRQSLAIRRTFDGSVWSSGLGDARLWRTTGGDPSPVAFPPGDIRGAADIAVDRNHELWITTLTPDSYHRVGTSWTKVTEALGRKPGVIGAMAGDCLGKRDVRRWLDWFPAAKNCFYSCEIISVAKTTTGNS